MRYRLVVLAPQAVRRLRPPQAARPMPETLSTTRPEALLSGAEALGVLRRLADVRRMSFRSEPASGPRVEGTGVVHVRDASADALTLEESGAWHPAGGPAVPVRTAQRWSRAGDRLRLEHLRFGAEAPVFLVEMALGADGAWRAARPHVCAADRYRATLRLEGDEVVLQWQVGGPKKDDVLTFRYA